MAKGKNSNPYNKLSGLTEQSDSGDVDGNQDASSLAESDESFREKATVIADPSDLSAGTMSGVSGGTASSSSDIRSDKEVDGNKSRKSRSVRNRRRRGRIRYNEPVETNRYICQLCDRSFRRIEHLRRHEATHTGTRSHKCPFCESAFFRGDVLVRHMRNVHGATIAGVKELRSTESTKSAEQENELQGENQVDYTEAASSSGSALYQHNKDDIFRETLGLGSRSSTTRIHPLSQLNSAAPSSRIGDRSSGASGLAYNSASEYPYGSQLLPHNITGQVMYASYGSGLSSYTPYGPYNTIPVNNADESQTDTSHTLSQSQQNATNLQRLGVPQDATQTAEYQAYMTSLSAMYPHMNPQVGRRFLNRPPLSGSPGGDVGQRSTQMHIPQQHASNYVSYHPHPSNPTQFTRYSDGMTYTNPTMQMLIAYGYGPYSPSSVDGISPSTLAPIPSPESNTENTSRYLVPSSVVQQRDRSLPNRSKTDENRNHVSHESDAITLASSTGNDQGNEPASTPLNTDPSEQHAGNNIGVDRKLNISDSMIQDSADGDMLDNAPAPTACSSENSSFNAENT